MSDDEINKHTELQRINPDAPLVSRRKQSSILRRVVVFSPLPLAKPEVDAHFTEMSSPVRVIESIRYSLVVLEYRLAPDGWLRAWLLSTLRVLLFVMIPLAGLVVVLSALVPLFGYVAGIFQNIELASRSLFWSVVYVVLTLLIVAAVVAAIPIILAKIRK